MPWNDLNGFPNAAGYTQQFLNSCWAACTRVIHEYYVNSGRNALGGHAALFPNDQAVGVHLHMPANGPMRSASASLEALGYLNNTDGMRVPTLVEIRDDAIGQGIPLLCLVTQNNVAPPAPGPGAPAANPHAAINAAGNVGGARHWVVIVGVNVAARLLRVYDPVDGIITEVPYDRAQFMHPRYAPNHMYWGNSSYVDPM